MKEYSREQFIKTINRNHVLEKRFGRDLHILITRAKQKEIISIPSQRKIICDNSYIQNLQNIASFLNWINHNETPHLRSSEQTKKLIDTLIECQQEDYIFTVFAFLCPSYRKGKDAVGFNNNIGETTKRGILNTEVTYKILSDLGFIVNCKIIFCDLILENYEELISKNLLGGIKANIRSVRSFVQSIDKNIDFKLFSDYRGVSEKIHPKGITNCRSRITKELYSLVLKRNKVFYKEQFNWGEEKIIDRTNVLSCSYPVVGDYLRLFFPRSLFVYTANSLERAAMYQGELASVNPISIFFPKKNKLVKY